MRPDETILSIDLAELNSAAAYGEREHMAAGTCKTAYTVAIPATATPSERASAIADWVRSLPAARADIIVIEDVFPFAVNPRPVLRLQGALLLVLHEEFGVAPELVMASAWQKDLGYKKKKGQSSKGWAKMKCEEVGFNLSAWKGKAAVDVRDAMLIGHWRAQR